VHHLTIGLRVIRKKKREEVRCRAVQQVVRPRPEKALLVIGWDYSSETTVVSGFGTTVVSVVRVGPAPASPKHAAPLRIIQNRMYPPPRTLPDNTPPPKNNYFT